MNKHCRLQSVTIIRLLLDQRLNERLVDRMACSLGSLGCNSTWTRQITAGTPWPPECTHGRNYKYVRRSNAFSHLSLCAHLQQRNFVTCIGLAITGIHGETVFLSCTVQTHCTPAQATILCSMSLQTWHLKNCTAAAPRSS